LAANLTKEQRLAKRRRAWSLRMKGWTEQRIADELQVNQSTVSRWLDQLTRRAVDQLDTLVTREVFSTLGILNHAIDEAIQAWERSKKPKRKGSKRSGPSSSKGSSGGSGETTIAESIERDGDPAFWNVAMAASDRKRQLLALDERFAPPKDDDSSKQAGGMTVLDALAAAEARDAAFNPDGDPTPDEPESTD
jgi:predicted transcriptional regulator